MRKLLIAIGVVMVLIMASPFVIGIIAENRLRDRVESGNDGQLIALRVADYDRGWLKSSARIELGLGEAYLSQIGAVTQQPQIADVLQTFAIPVIVEFTHGPILVGEISGIGFVGVKVHPDSQSQVIRAAEMSLGVPYLFEFRGKSEFGDGFHFTGDIPEFAGAIGDVSYDFSGVDLAGVSTLDHLEFEAVFLEYPRALADLRHARVPVAALYDCKLHLVGRRSAREGLNHAAGWKFEER